MNGRVCVVGSFMMDFTAYVDRRPRPGETVVGNRFATSLGGKGMNQAVAAARAGATTTMIGVVGNDDFGEAFVAQLEAEHVDVSRVRRHEHLGTGVGLPVVESNGENSIIVVPRANDDFSSDDIRRAKPLLESADVVLMQFELPLDPLVEATHYVRESGGLIIVNPAPAIEPPDAMVFDYLVVNAAEAADLTGDGECPPTTLAMRLRRRWPSAAVVVTLGSDGLVYQQDHHPTHVPSIRVQSIDAVGAGDAFCGFLAARLAEGASLDSAVREARIAGAISATRRGAVESIPTRAEVLSALGNDLLI